VENSTLYILLYPIYTMKLARRALVKQLYECLFKHVWSRNSSTHQTGLLSWFDECLNDQAGSSSQLDERWLSWLDEPVSKQSVLITIT